MTPPGTPVPTPSTSGYTRQLTAMHVQDVVLQRAPCRALSCTAAACTTHAVAQ